ncbi:MAG: CbiX/SirB N-terminal domain-containing protein [Verrucomicrobiia bacterium]
MSSNRKTGVLLVTHGSKLKEANWSMFPMVRELRRRLGNDRIAPCFMELGRPDIPTAVHKLVRRGCTHIFVHAFFLVPGQHLQKDIPRILREALKEHPDITFEIGNPMFTDPGLTDLVEQRLSHLLAGGESVS